MRLPFTFVLGLAATLALTGCATTASRCAPGEQRMVDDTLYFGTTKRGGTVSEEEWAEFLRATVTPSFPAGLTVWPASGQWRSADGSIVREASYVLRLVHTDSPESETAIHTAMSEYKSRFQQEAVLRMKGTVCASF